VLNLTIFFFLHLCPWRNTSSNAHASQHICKHTQ